MGAVVGEGAEFGTWRFGVRAFERVEQVVVRSAV